MPNNLTIQIAVSGGAAAKAALAEIGRAVKQTATDVNDANKTATGAWGSLLAAFGATKRAVEPVGQAFGELGRSLGELKNSASEMADRVFPHFKEIAALSLAAVTVELGRLIVESAQAVRATENMAKTLGFTTEQFEAMRLTAAQAGVDQDSFSASLSIFARRLGQAREEQAKLTGAIQGGVTVLEGGAKSLDSAGVVLTGHMREMPSVVGNAISVIRGGVKPVLDFKDAFKAAGVDISQFPDNAKGNLAALAQLALNLDKMKDSAIKAAIAQQGFGRGWRESFPAFIAIGHGMQSAIGTIEKYGIGIEASEQRQANAFMSAYTTMKFVLDRVKEMVGNALGAAATPLIEAFTEAIGQNAEKLRGWATSIADSVMPVVGDLITLLKGGGKEDLQTGFVKTLVEWGEAAPRVLSSIAAAFNGLMSALDGVAAGMNYIFGTETSGKALLIIGLVGSMTGVFSTLGAAVLVGVAAFQALFAILGVIAGVLGWPVTLAAAVVAITAYMIDWNQVWIDLQGTASAFWDLLKSFSEWLVDKLVAAWNAVADAASKALSLFGGATGPGGSTESGPAPSMPFQTGGLVRGPSGIDRVPARLTDGEFVMSAPAVRQVGVGFLAALNAMGRGVRAFAHGGLVSASRSILPDMGPRLAYATGGTVSASDMPSSRGVVAVDLSHGGETFPILTTHDVATRLVQHSNSEQMTQTGAKPTWFGGRGTG